MARPTEIEKLEELIKKSISGELIEQTVEPLVAPGENYGSVIYKVDFKVKNEDKVETYHGVAKCTPPNKVTQEIFNIQVATKAEIGWYTTVIPTIRDFQRECGVEQVADFFQNFYGARISLDPNSDVVDINAVILTENLKPLGYKNMDRHIGFDLKTSKAILRDLATFHAVPIAIKMKNKELFDKNIMPYLLEFENKDDTSIKPNPFDGVIKALEKLPEIAPYVDRIRKNIKNNNPFLKRSEPKEPWGSVCHNDFWVNNIMVKEGRIPKTVFLDFQVQFYGSIAIDVVFFLMVSVALDVIKNHMDELIQYYWEEFLVKLKQLNIDTSIFTYDEYLQEIATAASGGQFVHIIMHAWVILQDKGFTVFDSTDTTLKMENLENSPFDLNDRHKEKYKWLIPEYIKRGWL